MQGNAKLEPPVKQGLALEGSACRKPLFQYVQSISYNSLFELFIIVLTQEKDEMNPLLVKSLSNSLIWFVFGSSSRYYFFKAFSICSYSRIKKDGAKEKLYTIPGQRRLPAPKNWQYSRHRSMGPMCTADRVRCQNHRCAVWSFCRRRVPWTRAR